MRRENLILVHSFPTNSVLLSGFIEYLSEYFEVRLIDLPGFAQAVRPLPEISLDRYAQFVEEKIQDYQLESYWLGGISFGFCVISHIQPGPNCKGFVAMEPYLGSSSLKMSFLKSSLYRLLFRCIAVFDLSSFLWSNRLFRRCLLKLGNYSSDEIDVLFKHIDGRTFFYTAALILGNHVECGFKDLPYILVANEDDQTVDYDYIFKTFTANVARLLVVNTSIAHYPRELTKSYFKAHIPEEVIETVLDFMGNHAPQRRFWRFRLAVVATDGHKSWDGQWR